MQDLCKEIPIWICIGGLRTSQIDLIDDNVQELLKEMHLEIVLLVALRALATKNSNPKQFDSETCKKSGREK